MNFLVQLSLMLMALGIRRVIACTCYPQHPQQMFCRSDFVVKAKILSKKLIDLEQPDTVSPNEAPIMPAGYGFPQRRMKLEYTVKIEKIYKGDNLLVQSTEAKITTSANDGICGVTHLQEDAKVIMAGTLLDGELHISSCDFVRYMSELTKRQKQGLKYHWKNDCENGCSVEICFGSYCPSRSQNNSCLMNISSWQCETNYARCIKDDTGACGWMGKRDYIQCTNAQKTASRTGQPVPAIMP